MIEKNEYKMSDDEELKISRLLSVHHSVFQTFWDIGTPIFTDRIPTAAVGFDPMGEVIYMIINPDFWASRDMNNKLFIIAHECLHVILNHGKRGSDYKDFNLLNIAQDIVINEMLVSGFGFNKYEIKDWEKLCFVDTLFEKEVIIDKDIHKKGSFRYYLNLLEKNKHSEEQETLDEHSNQKGLDSDIQDLIDSFQNNSTEVGDIFHENMDGKLSDKEKLDLSNELKSEILDSKDSKAGEIALGDYINIRLNEKVKSNKKWEEIVRNHIKSIYNSRYVEKDSWITTGRRFAGLDDGLLYQGKWSTLQHEKEKYKLVFFLDASGSCYSYAKKFVKLLQSIPEKAFEIEAYSFDTSLYPIDIKTGKIQGCGGTSFRILDNHIRKITAEGKHPDAVFVLSDGDGDYFTPEKAKLWHWILTPYSHDTYIPKESKRHKMKDFE